jgi:hypothetical protein
VSIRHSRGGLLIRTPGTAHRLHRRRMKKAETSISVHNSYCSSVIPISSTISRVTSTTERPHQSRDRPTYRHLLPIDFDLCPGSAVHVGHRTGKWRDSICAATNLRMQSLQKGCPHGSMRTIDSSRNVSMHTPQSNAAAAAAAARCVAAASCARCASSRRLCS